MLTRAKKRRRTQQCGFTLIGEDATMLILEFMTPRRQAILACTSRKMLELGCSVWCEFAYDRRFDIRTNGRGLNTTRHSEIVRVTTSESQIIQRTSCPVRAITMAYTTGKSVYFWDWRMVDEPIIAYKTFDGSVILCAEQMNSSDLFVPVAFARMNNDVLNIRWV